MKHAKRLFALLLVLCLMVQLVPFRAEAKSVKLYESAKANVPLRLRPGKDNNIEGYISQKGIVVTGTGEEQIIKAGKEKHTWLEVKVPGSAIGNNAADSVYWIYIENLAPHNHRFSGRFCTVRTCPASSLKIDSITPKNVKITVADAPLRRQPYSTGDVIQKYKVGDVVTITGTLVNYCENEWYEVAGGDMFIFSKNTNVASAAKSNAKNNSEGKKNPAVRSIDYIINKPAPCEHKYQQGYCVNCGDEFKLTITKVKDGNFQTTVDDAKARAVPYQNGQVKKTYAKAGTKVSINAKTTNSAGNTWYRTTDGYWIYGVEDVTLKSVSVHAEGFGGTSYAYQNIDAKVKLVYKTTPAKANITSVTWTSSNPNIVDVDKNGNLVRKGYDHGKTIITCTVKSKEGNTASCDFVVTMSELLTLPDWNYGNNNIYNSHLALQCAEYVALAYPSYAYKDIEYTDKTDNNKKKMRRYVYQTDNKALRLEDALQEDHMNYKKYNFGSARSYYNSPFTLASKYYKINGNTKVPVIYVIITGSFGYYGWHGNMMMTGETYNEAELNTQYTFRLAAQDIQNKLAQYATQFSAKPIVVVTGHSRGGAVGNLLAEYLNHDSRYRMVYAYNFAVPNATRTPSGSSNIFNICNSDDIVTMIPLSAWGYSKNGQTKMFSSSQLYKNNLSEFREFVNQEMRLCDVKFKGVLPKRNTPDYSYPVMKPADVRDYMAARWPTVWDYYNKLPGYYGGYYYDDSAYHFIRDGLANAAAFDDETASKYGVNVLLNHVGHGGKDSCVFQPIAAFFIGNGVKPAPFPTLAAFADSHEAYTYYAAMLAFADLQDVNPMYYFSEDETAYGNETVALNADEQQVLLDFFEQDENPLMLEEAGWDIDDPATWEGVKWDLDGHIVVLDLSYLGLSGWLDVTELPKLEKLDIDGNAVSMLAASGLEELTELNCFMNKLTNLTVDECSNLQQLNCSFNQINTLDLSNLSRLSDVNCYGNQLTELDLDGTSSLQTLRCGDNNLTTLDVSSSSNLNTLFCEGNRILEAANPQLSAAVAAINESGGDAEIGTQQYLDNFGFNADEVENLTEFANTSYNLNKLGWDLSDPWSWEGVEWKIYGNEYHITSLNLDGLDVMGDLNLPDAAYLESLSCSNSALSSITLTGCASLDALDCSNNEISELEITGCSSLNALSCSGNFLAAEEVESSLNQIGLQTGVIDYEDQNIAADEDNFDPQERAVLLDLLCTGNNADVLGWDEEWPGTWSGVKWTKDDDGVYHVRVLDLAHQEIRGSLDLTAFSYLEDFSFAGTLLEQVDLPDCLAIIPENAFYNSAVKTITIPEGVTRINQSAFAYSEALQLVVLPTTLAKIDDMAFYGCGALKDVVFLGDELLETGSGILEDTSPQLMLTIPADRSWDEDCDLLIGRVYQQTDADYLVRIDDSLRLEEDTAYSETNQYPGTDVAVTLIRLTPEQSETLCILSVTSEDGAAREIHTSHLNLSQTVSHIVMEDVNLQYAGEEMCDVQVFLLSDGARYTPLALQHELTLTKPVQSES